MKKKILIFIISIVIFNIYNVCFAVKITSPSAVVICKESGRILYDKNATEKRKMASLTKMMTAILLVENCKLNEEITIPKEAAYIGGSEAGIKANDIVTAENLLYGLLLPSGNDCAVAIAYHVGGSISGFADLMNKRVQELGISDTHFENPHGLDSDEHYTSAYSLALITRYALNYNKISEVVSTKQKLVNLGSFSKTLSNTNSLLRTYSKATGAKTGFTNGANRCLIASAIEDEFEIIAVVLGSDTSDIRFKETVAILEETFKTYKLYDISSFLNVYIDIPVIKGTKSRYIKTYSEIKKVGLTQEEYDNILVSQNFITSIEAPMERGTYLGTYKVSLEDEILYQKDFYLEYDLIKKTPIDYFKYSILNMFDTLEKI